MKYIKINAIWCPACIKTNKIWKELKDVYNLDVVELDYDFDEDKVKPYDVGDILPVVIKMDNDREVSRLIGEKTKDEIISFIEED